MVMKLKHFFILSTLILGIGTINSCKKEEKEIDKELYELAKETSGFVWYKNSSSLSSKSSGSGHPQTSLRTRYNSIAAAKLDANGKIIANTTFAEGSLIVKELYENSTELTRYAILFKKSDSPFADDKGWVWGYINANGKVAEAASNKGKACISCHNQADNIDYMLMNKYFP
jgi:hypothetical protein